METFCLLWNGTSPSTLPQRYSATLSTPIQAVMPGVPQAENELGPIPNSDFALLGSHCRWEHAARRPGLHTTWTASTTVTSSRCLSSLSILRAPAAQSHDDFSSPDTGVLSMSDPARPVLCKQVLSSESQVTWFFLTRVLDSKNNLLASQVGWGFLICIFKAFVVTGTIPISHHFTVAISRIFLKLWFSEWKDALLFSGTSKQAVEREGSDEFRIYSYSIAANEFICLSYKFSWFSECIQLHFEIWGAFIDFYFKSYWIWYCNSHYFLTSQQDMLMPAVLL